MLTGRKIALFSVAAVAGVTAAMIAQTAPAAPGDASALPPQVEAGKAVYAEHCAECHGEALDGSDLAPGLKADMFRGSWDGQSARELYNRIITTMPLTNPGSLDPKSALDVTAFILATNEQRLPATGYASADDLDKVTIAKTAE